MFTAESYPARRGTLSNAKHPVGVQPLAESLYAAPFLEWKHDVVLFCLMRLNQLITVVNTMWFWCRGPLWCFDCLHGPARYLFLRYSSTNVRSLSRFTVLHDAMYQCVALFAFACFVLNLVPT